MIYKYEVPRKEKKKYKGKSILYCKVEDAINMGNGIVLLRVKNLNLEKESDYFLNTELKKLNLLDRLKVLLYII